MRCFTHVGIVVCQLGIRLSYHRITRASPLQSSWRPKITECDSFQNRDMGSQYHSVVNRTFYVVGWSRDQHTKCVSYSQSSINTLRLPGFVHVAVTMVREVSHCQSNH